MNLDELAAKPWWEYMETDIQELVRESVLLAKRVQLWEEKFHDYSFVVFPVAKAYEGFLKKMFLDLGFITQAEYSGKHFRIGRALNPSLDRNRYADESVYDKIVEYCGGEDLAAELWKTWKACRNTLFHWFPEEKNAITLSVAREKVERVLYSFDLAFKECKLI